MFHIVEFIKRKEVAVVPGRWVNFTTNLCLWPPYLSDQKVEEAASGSVEPEAHWKKYRFRVLQTYRKDLFINVLLLFETD